MRGCVSNPKSRSMRSRFTPFIMAGSFDYHLGHELLCQQSKPRVEGRYECPNQ